MEYRIEIYPDEPALSLSILTDRKGWTALMDIAGASLTAHMLTETATPDTATSSATCVILYSLTCYRPIGADLGLYKIRNYWYCKSKLKLMRLSYKAIHGTVVISDL